MNKKTLLYFFVTSAMLLFAVSCAHFNLGSDYFDRKFEQDLQVKIVHKSEIPKNSTCRSIRGNFIPIESFRGHKIIGNNIYYSRSSLLRKKEATSEQLTSIVPKCILI